MIYKIQQINADVFPFKTVVVIIIIFKYIFQQYINYRQLKMYMVKKIPIQIAKLRITQDQFTKSQNYSFDKAFQMYVLSLKMALDCIFILCNILPLVWQKVGVVFFFIDNDSQFQRGFCFLLVESLKSKVFQVPISLYQTFVIEKKYEYTNKTFQIFVYDLFVECGLMLIILPPILYGYLRIVDTGGQYFYLSVQIFVLFITLILTWIYPNFIAPLFNQFSELGESNLRTKINILANQINFPLRKIYLMNGSVRSAHSNAYFYGFGSNKRIVLYDTLMKKLNEQQIVSVVGHELGHWKHNHSLLKFFVYVFQVFCIFYIFSFFRNNENIFISFGFKQKSTFIGTALFFSLFDPISSIFQIINLVLSRYFEFQADMFACQQGYSWPLFKSLKKLFRENATSMTPDDLYAWFRHSHPTMHERIKKIKQYEQQMNSQTTNSKSE